MPQPSKLNHQADLRIRIVIAEDHATIREVVKLLLDTQPDLKVVGEAGDGRTTVRLTQELKPDIVLLDISMPDMNGLEATLEIIKLCPGVKVLAFSSHTENYYVQEMMRAGASGYVLKLNNSAELIRAIQIVAGGGRYLTPLIAEELESKEVEGKSQSMLTSREERVLCLIAWGHSPQEIAKRLGCSAKTVEAHKANSMRKLGIRNRIELTSYALLQGWFKNQSKCEAGSKKG